MAQDYLGGRFPTDSTTIEDMFSAQGNPATDDITDLNAFADDVRTGNCSNVDAIVS